MDPHPATSQQIHADALVALARLLVEHAEDTLRQSAATQ